MSPIILTGTVGFIQSEASDTQAALLIFGLIAAVIGSILLLRYLARSAALSFAAFMISLAAFSHGMSTYNNVTGLGGLALGLISALAFVLALVGAVSRGVGRAVTNVTGSETLGELATLGTAVAIGGTVLGELGVDAGEGGDTSPEGMPLGIGDNHALADATGEAHICSDGEIHLGDHPSPEGYGAPSEVDGDPRTNPVHGHWRTASDGSQEYVRPHWKGDRG